MRYSEYLSALVVRSVTIVIGIVLTAVLTASCSLFHEDQIEALIEAAIKGDLKKLQHLLDSGVDINIRGRAGYTALFAATTFGRLETVNLLLKRGADMNTKSRSGHTPLLIAVASFQSNKAKLLLEKGADFNIKEPQSDSSPLMLAARNNMGEIAKLLLDNGSDINEKGRYYWTALYWSIYGGHVEMVKLLLEKGADVNATTPYGRTALMEAAAPDHLMKTDTPDSQPVKRYGPIYPDRSRDLEVVKLLLEHGADDNATDKDGWTALKRAQKRGHKEIVELLKAHGGTE